MNIPLTPISPDYEDDGVPVIIEHPESYPWGPDERAQWREATEDEYQRYLEYYSRNGESE